MWMAAERAGWRFLNNAGRQSAEHESEREKVGGRMWKKRKDDPKRLPASRRRAMLNTSTQREE